MIDGAGLLLAGFRIYQIVKDLARADVERMFPLGPEATTSE